MTTELVLLLGLFAFILLGVLTSTPKETFFQSGPRLGARIERQIIIGEQFKVKGQTLNWAAPEGLVE